MKELTTEEKAKRYDEALKVLHKYDGANIMFSQSLKEEMFPELKEESEDERIRNIIKQSLKYYFEGKLSIGTNDTDYAECLAWLEKQKAIDVLDEEEREFADNVDSYRKEVDAAYQTVYNEGVKATLEKQGEHANFLSKIQVGDKVTRNEDGVLVNLSQLKRIAKSADKVKPKFHKGEWIIFNGLTLFVKEVGKGFYRTYQDNIPDGYYWDIDNVARLWTIQDAKDGDVLCDYCNELPNPLIFILKKFEHVDFGLAKKSDYSSYCFLKAAKEQEFQKGSYHHKHNIFPATKEQRDLLFQKMVDAGYTFDFEKKELKEIEQKPAWSEEDDTFFKAIIRDIENIQYISEDAKKNRTNWLKSLKDRVQPKQEWSEEMKDAVDAEITKISPNDHLRVVSDVLPLKDESEWGTKVKIIIIKQE